jgi:Xaa-Pro aminopeptidase
MEQRARHLMQSLAGKADCALVTDDCSRRYLTGMKSSAGFLLCFPEKTYLLIDFRYIEKARETALHCEVIEQKNTYEQLAALLKRHGAETVAVESRSLTLQKLAALKEKLSGVEFLTDDTLSSALYALRTVKSREELHKIQMAQQLAEAALQQLLEELCAGMTEREIALRLDFHMRRNGAEDLSFETIALTGAHTSMPHGVPDDRSVQRGDFVLMDFGAVVDGYHSDMTRTVCVGTPSEEMQNVYEIVRTAQETALARVRAGITGHELDAAGRDVITAAGYGDAFGHSLGHGVGMEIHEFPVAAPKQQALLAEGNVVTVEPGIYLPGKFGVRIEDFVYVTKNGCENLTKFTNKLICL